MTRPEVTLDKQPVVTPQRLVYSLNEAAKQLNIGHCQMSELVNADQIRAFRSGRRWLISHQACLEHIAQQEARTARQR